MTKIVSTCGFVCERVLREDDDVFSAIRVVDVHQFTEVPQTPAIQLVEVSTLVLIRAEMDVGESEHVLELFLTSPVGPERLVLKQSILFSKRIDDESVLGGTTIHTVIAIKAQAGRHFLRIVVDGVELQTVYFTLLRREP